MGQQQSSNGEEANAKRSYYDVLDVPRSANDEAIRKAYHKKALELHPDRNLDNIEEATQSFAEVQAAYEVLSDPQDRAWYDSHESQVLFGSAEDNTGSDIPVTTTDDIIRFYTNFHGRNNLNSSTTEFFLVLRQMFEKLAHEESVFSEIQGGEAVDYPSFGHAEDDANEATKHFYNVWTGFSTCKSFAWKDKYRLNEATDRRMKRAMEKENRKLREDAIKEFNSTVRTLVNFVRKRDHRLGSSTQTDTQRHEALRERAAAQAARARAANQAKMGEQNVPNWMANQDSNDDLSVELWEDEEEKVDMNFECVVCNKIFKTEKQYEAHERSKKHVQSVRHIRQQMRREGLDLGLDEDADEYKTEKKAASCDESQIQNSEKSSPSGRTVPTSASIEDENKAAEGLGDTVLDSVPVGFTAKDNHASLNYVSPRTGEASDQSSNANKRQVPENATPKKGKAKLKRAKKIAKAASMEDKNLSCTTCNESFQSKTQLFRHLRISPSHTMAKGGT